MATEDASLLSYAAASNVSDTSGSGVVAACAAEWHPRGSSSESGDDELRRGGGSHGGSLLGSGSADSRSSSAVGDPRRRRDLGRGLGAHNPPHPRANPYRSTVDVPRNLTRPDPRPVGIVETRRRDWERVFRERDRGRNRVRFPDYELVEAGEEDEVDEGEVSDDPSSSMLSQILSR